MITDTKTDFTKTLQSLYLLAAQNSLKKAQIERIDADTQRKNMEHVYQEFQRPWRQMGAFIRFDSEKGQWKCEFQGAAAWGDTPEIACNNFDHLWTHGT